LEGDSARIQARLDGLYDEPGFRPPSERAKVGTTDGRITISSSDTSGAARIEYLASTRGVVTFRLIAGDSIVAALLDTADGWLRSHPEADAAGANALNDWISYRRHDYRVLEQGYPLVSKALRTVDTAVFGDWQPVIGALDTGKTDTSRILFFVERKPEITIEKGRLVASAAAQRFRGTRPRNAPPAPEETQPYVVGLQLSNDSFAGFPVRRLAALTSAHIGQRLAMMLDTLVLAAPVIQSEIPDGSFMVVTGDTLGFYARDLATILLSGPLYAPLVVERVERVRGR
jgi:hypothetical protein